MGYTIAVRSAAITPELTERVRKEIHALDPALAIYNADYGVKPHDPTTFLVGPLFLAAVALNGVPVAGSAGSKAGPHGYAAKRVNARAWRTRARSRQAFAAETGK